MQRLEFKGTYLKIKIYLWSLYLSCTFRLVSIFREVQFTVNEYFTMRNMVTETEPNIVHSLAQVAYGWPFDHTTLLFQKVAREMDFSYIRNFNMLVLGKQGCMKLTNTNSPCASVLKGKYFHDSGFLAARKTRNFSHTWRSILQGRKSLNLGMIKCIGDGSSFRIWVERWDLGIPRNTLLIRKPDDSLNRSLNSSPLMVPRIHGRWRKICCY